MTKKFFKRLRHKLVIEPETGEKELKKVLRRLFYLSLLIFSCSFILGAFVNERFHRNEVLQLEKVTNELIDQQLVQNDKYLTADSISQSTLYKIQKIENIAEVNIPKTISPEHLNLMLVTAKYYNIPLRIYFRIAYKESRFNPNVVSPKNARGYFQIRDITFNTYKDNLFIKNLTNENNIKISGLILSDLKRRYKSWDLALAAYNAGPAVVDSCRCVPNYKETQEYVKFILE